MLAACAPQRHWPPRTAEHPATAAELAVYEVSVRAPDAERQALVRALAAHGFRVVDHPPYRGNLEAILTDEGNMLVATLRSDGFFVDEALGTSLDELAATFARSARVAEFIRNSGLPQQRAVPGN